MSGSVYFLRAVSGEGAIKIGSSWDVGQRLQSYMQWSPVPLEVILTIPSDICHERNLHDCFADAHSHSEWFHPIPRLVEAIAAMRSGVPVDEAVDLTDLRGNVRGKINEASRVRNGNPASHEFRRSNAAIKTGSAS